MILGSQTGSRIICNESWLWNMKNKATIIWLNFDIFGSNTNIKVDYESNVFTVVLGEVLFYVADLFELVESDVWTFVNRLEYVAR